MTGTQDKLMQASIMLEQATQHTKDYPWFIANLDCFVTSARSITLVMKAEFDKVPGFHQWYSERLSKVDTEEFKFFNQLRVDTTHVKPFKAESRYFTNINEPFIVPGGSTIGVPAARKDGRGNLIIDDQRPLLVDGKEVKIKRSTVRSYFFSDKPEEDAIKRCQAYLQTLQEMVIECHEKFKLP